MKKVLSLLLSLVLSLAVCSGCRTEPGRNIPGYEQGKKNVIFYTWGSPEENLILQEIIDDFKVENTDINVIISKAGNDYYGDLEYKLAGNQSPDIVLMKPGNIQPFLNKGAIISLQDYIDQSQVIDKDSMIWDVNDGYRYNASTKQIGGKGDPVYSLIKDFSPDFVMNYNKQLVTDTVGGLDYPKENGTKYPSTTQPMSWTQYKGFAGAMTKDDGSTMGAALDNEPFQQLMEWIQMGGGSLFSADDRTVVDIKNTPAVRQAFDYYRELRDECSGNRYVTKQSSVQIGPGQLKERQAASIFYGRWAYSTYRLDSASKLECAFAPPPVPDTLTVENDTKYAGITAMVGMSISAMSSLKAEAFKFIEYYFTKGQEKLALMGYNVPGNKAVAQDEFVNSAELSAKEKQINQMFLNLALNNAFVIQFNRYLTQSSIEKNVFSPNFSQYFADSKGKAFSLSRWESTLSKIQTDLQSLLNKAVSAA